MDRYIATGESVRARVPGTSYCPVEFRGTVEEHALDGTLRLAVRGFEEAREACATAGQYCPVEDEHGWLWHVSVAPEDVLGE